MIIAARSRPRVQRTVEPYSRGVPTPTKQAPPPLQVDTAKVVLVGIGVWAVALVVVLLLGDRVDRMWTWTCLAAIGLAVVGLGVMRLQGQLGRKD